MAPPPRFPAHALVYLSHQLKRPGKGLAAENALACIPSPARGPIVAVLQEETHSNVTTPELPHSTHTHALKIHDPRTPRNKTNPQA